MTDSERPLALVVGIGNPDRGDDGFGPTVVQRLRGRVPSTVRILERTGDALALIEDWDGIPSVIVMDAVAAISQPGRVHRLDLTDSPLPIGFAPRSSHAFGLAETVELARSLGRLPQCLVAYLVEGQRFRTGAPLSSAVAEASEDVAERVVVELSAILGAKGSACHA
jgi:hydrogenase maturation protease